MQTEFVLGAFKRGLRTLASEIHDRLGGSRCPAKERNRAGWSLYGQVMSYQQTFLGCYRAQRAAALSGVPASTVYGWARKAPWLEVYV